MAGTSSCASRPRAGESRPDTESRRPWGGWPLHASGRLAGFRLLHSLGFPQKFDRYQSIDDIIVQLFRPAIFWWDRLSRIRISYYRTPAKLLGRCTRIPE